MHSAAPAPSCTHPSMLSGWREANTRSHMVTHAFSITLHLPQVMTALRAKQADLKEVMDKLAALESQLEKSMAEKVGRVAGVCAFVGKGVSAPCTTVP